MEIDPSDFLKGLNLYDGKTFGASKRQIHLNGSDLERKAKELTPLHKGDLTRSGVTTRPKEIGNRQGIEVTVGFNESYAASTHELMEPAPGATLKPSEGPGRTTGKDGNEFGPAGGKYLSRPLQGKMKVYTRKLADAIKRVTR